MSIRNVEIGKVYEFNHSRKGIFKGKVIALRSDGGPTDDVDVVLQTGAKAVFMSGHHAYEGEIVTIRLGLCSWKEVQP